MMISQKVLNRAARAHGHRLRRAVYARVLGAMRRSERGAKRRVTWCVEDVPLALPLSHNLPLYTTAHPNYATNLTRVARIVAGKYSGASAIDIGANVGDSAVRMRLGGIGPILCIEGDRVFGAFLESNAARLSDVYVERVYVDGQGEQKGEVRVSRSNGSARLGARGEQVVAPMVSVADVVAAHPAFSDARLIKIDTDGMDLELAAGVARAITSHRPVLFFEYDPTMQAIADAVAGLMTLADLGYESGLAWDNVGEYMFEFELADSGLIRDVTGYFGSGRAKGYLDLAVFGAADADLQRTIRLGELRHFRKGGA